MYRWNPSTPAIPAVQVCSNGTPTDFLRMSVDPATGIIYAMGTDPATLHRIAPPTGTLPDVCTYTGTATNFPATTPPVPGSGDIGFAPTGALFYVGESGAGGAGSVRLWSINIATNTFINIGAVTGLPNVANGITFNAAGNPILSASGALNLYTLPITGGAVAAMAGALPLALTDLASGPLANAGITKTDGVNSVASGGTTTYTIVVSNAGPGLATSANVRDPLVAGLTKTAVACVAAGGAACPTPAVTVASLEVGVIVPNIPVGGTLTFTVNANVTATTGPVSNTATVTLPVGFDPTPGNNTATDNNNLNPTISKAFVPASIAAGVVSTLTITLNNPNAGIATLSANLTDTLPAGVTVATPNGLGGTCTGTKTAVAGSATVTYNTGGTIPANGSCTIDVKVTSTTDGPANNSIPIGALQTNNGNSPAAANATLTITPLADLGITKTDTVPAVSTYTPGTTGSYTLTVTNAGPSAVTAATVTDNLPLGVTLTGPWTCTTSAGSSCSAASGGVAGGNAVSLTLNLLATGTATITVPVQYDSNPANY
ncbi:MAG: hypothetical protein WCE88_09060 [Burkholderiales bacterium]